MSCSLVRSAFCKYFFGKVILPHETFFNIFFIVYIITWSSKKLYDKENEQKDSAKNKQKNKELLNFILTGINCARQLRNYVSYIIHNHYESTNKCHVNSINNLIKFENVLNYDTHIENYLDEIIYKRKNFVKYSFLIDEIKNLLTQPSRRIGCNLTERYCNQKILHYMKYQWLNKNLSRFERQPVKEQLLEQIATIVAQWFQPEKDVFYSCIKASSDSIAQEVLNCLRKKHPNHSIFSTSAETFTYWKNNNIDDNYWNEAERTQIMDTLQKYIFGKLNFRPSNSEGTNLEYIDNVLKNKCGHETILLIIYHSVARRLGLRCDVLNLRIALMCHHSIFWKPKYATNSLENATCFKIISKKFPDCIVNQLSMFRTQYLSVGSYNAFATTAQQMWLEMRELFAYVINQYTPFGINTQDYYGVLVVNHELSLCIEKTEQLNTRPEDVKFAVGMIVAHGDQPTENCAGVIIGWHRYVDRHITFSLKDDTDMDIRALPLNHCRNFRFIKRQTNYIILTENNKMCYVGRDTITLTTPKWIENSEIGRYFCTFEDTHYVPNKMLASVYPQDAITAALTAKSGN